MSANWHWKTKSTKPWADQWFNSELTKLAVKDVKITSVSPAEGDCEIGMRKSKVITIYDLRVTSNWENQDGSIKGTLTAVEVSHDMEDSDYVFETTVEQSGAEADSAKEQARTSLADLCRPIFTRFPKEMVSVHGKDLLKDESPNTSGRSTPLPPTAPAATSSSTTSSTAKASSGNAGHSNTTTVRVESSFMISADGLFETLTDPTKVQMWTRNQAKISPQVGSEVSLFGGNITGKVTAVDAPKSITMTWRPPTWPEGHYGTLVSTLTQNASDTTLTMRLDGVPLGKEEETEKNLDVYYIRSLKQIGLGTLL